MGKILTSLGLMSGTSGDGIDASIIKSNGDINSTQINNLELIEDKFFEYEKKTIKKIHLLRNKINFHKDLQIYKKEIDDIQREITLFHAKATKDLIKSYEIDLIGFHGHTIYHNPKEKISYQMGDAKLLSQLAKKKVIFNFRENDIKNGGEGAPLAPLYHHAISQKKKINLPFDILNIGGISNLTSFCHKTLSFKARDIGPGNCLIDRWVRENSNFNFDEGGYLAKNGKINRLILEQVSEHSNKISEGRSILETQRSLDIKDYDLSFVRGLTLEDGAATLTEYTAELLCEAIFKFSFFYRDLPKDLYNKLILTGGGRKNNHLVKKIKEKLKNTFKVIMIDDFDIDGDFIESQAFAFLAIRSFKKLPITFPETTGCNNPCQGGELISF